MNKISWLYHYWDLAQVGWRKQADRPKIRQDYRTINNSVVRVVEQDPKTENYRVWVKNSGGGHFLEGFGGSHERTSYYVDKKGLYVPHLMLF